MYRDDFPMLKKKVHGKPLVYLDSAATALKPKKVIDTLSNFYSHDYATVNRGVYNSCKEATGRYHKVREQVADFLCASSWEEVVFTSGTTHGLNLLAKGLSQNILKKGDEVILSEMEHHANIVPWQMEKQRVGFNIKFAPIDSKGNLDCEKLEKMISPQTKVLSICHLSNALGVVNPVEKLSKLASKHKLIFILDAAQSVAHLPLNVQKLGVDFLVFSGHKIYGPTGVGVLYGKKESLSKLPPLFGGGDMIDRVSFEEVSFTAPPHCFEAGTPMIAEVMGLGAALEYVTQDISFQSLMTHDNELTKYLYDSLNSLDRVRILGPSKRLSLVSFTVDRAHPLDIATMLDFSGIALRSGHHCTQPLMQKLGLEASLRASIGIYNSFEDIDYFIQELKKLFKTL